MCGPGPRLGLGGGEVHLLNVEIHVPAFSSIPPALIVASVVPLKRHKNTLFDELEIEFYANVKTCIIQT